MNEKLQQAITASRTGQKQDAQRLLTQLLREDPNEPQAWFLLSHLVDSKQKQVAYLSKTLALDPHHEKARQRLDRLTVASPESGPSTAGYPAPDVKEPPQPAFSVSTDQLDFLEQEKGETVPAWMADDIVNQVAAEMVEEAPTLVTATPTTIEQADLPDWLQQDVSAAWAEPKAAEVEQAPLATESMAKPLAPKPDTTSKALVVTKPTKPVPTTSQQVVTLTRVMMALILAAVVVFILLVYFLIQLL